MGEDFDHKDRRRSSRVHKHGKAEVLRSNGKNTVESVQIMNISEGGVRFVASGAYDEGEICVVRIGKEERRVRVHHCKQLFSGYAVRAEFVAESA